MTRLIASLAACATLTIAPPVAAAPRVERIVMVMRHGVRAPITGEVPADTRVKGTWPTWPVAPEALTPHGAAAIAHLARYDRRWRTAKGCPSPGSVVVWTNTAERTIATGRAWADAFAPGCGLPVGHLAAGRIDPLFEPLRARATAFDATEAVTAIAAYTGGADALTARHADTIRRLDRVLGCGDPGGCSTPGPATLTPSANGTGVDFTGPIRSTSGTAQVLQLQYAEGMPMAQVGFGRADAGTIRKLGTLHAALFDVFTRSPYMAAHQSGPIGQRILSTLADPDGPRIEILVGHDTNVTAVAAALGVNLYARGFAPNDAAPGAALVFERLHDARGSFVRVSYRAQPLDAIRSGASVVTTRRLRVPGCPARCPVDRFDAILRARIAPVVARR